MDQSDGAKGVGCRKSQLQEEENLKFEKGTSTPKYTGPAGFG